MLGDERDVADPYFDDILIGSRGDTREEAIKNHDAALRRGMIALERHEMVADKAKCKLYMTAV